MIDTNNDLLKSSTGSSGNEGVRGLRRKSACTVTLDTDLLIKVRVKRVNLSKLLNDYLKAYLNIEEEQDLSNKAQIQEDLMITEANLIDLKAKMELIKQKEDKQNQLMQQKIQEEQARITPL